MSETERDYATNYRKPPLHTRFEKGQSGNPRGRPAKNLATLLAAALNQPGDRYRDQEPPAGAHQNA